MSNNFEKNRNSPEKNGLSPEVAHEGEKRREQLRDNLERAGEQDHENLDEARHDALEKAHSLEKAKPKDNEQRETSPAEKRKGPISKHERDASFSSTMHEVQAQMSAPSRAFSKIIHNKAVENVSEVAGSTIARPNAMLSGAIFAFILTLAVYLVAKNIGYPLSGFETIGAFILGWALGIVYDFLKVMVTGRK